MVGRQPSLNGGVAWKVTLTPKSSHWRENQNGVWEPQTNPCSPQSSLNPELWNASEMVHDPVHAKLACLSPETNSDCGLKDLARA